MKNKKILIIALVAVMLVVALMAVACEKDVTDNTDLTLQYASQCTSLKVEVSKDGSVIYVYDNGEITNEHNFDIDVSKIVGAVGEKGLLLKKSDFKDGYEFKSENDIAQLNGKLKDAKTLIGVDAEVSISIKADLKAKTVSEYKATYTDANGCEVVITLA